MFRLKYLKRFYAWSNESLKHEFEKDFNGLPKCWIIFKWDLFNLSVSSLHSSDVSYYFILASFFNYFKIYVAKSLFNPQVTQLVDVI